MWKLKLSRSLQSYCCAGVIGGASRGGEGRVLTGSRGGPGASLVVGTLGPGWVPGYMGGRGGFTGHRVAICSTLFKF